jgi:hypothetical protein
MPARDLRGHPGTGQRNCTPAQQRPGPSGKATGASIHHATGSLDRNAADPDVCRAAAQPSAGPGTRTWTSCPAAPIPPGQALPNPLRMTSAPLQLNLTERRLHG